MGGIFISYRRSDSQGEAGRLFDDLVNQFGEQTVFMDVAGIEAGRDFRKAIEEGVTKCGVLLVVMGPEWLNAKNESGARRLDDPTDFVRIETAAVLKRDIPVIPVLVRAAQMPRPDQLPEDLKELAYRNCIELTHARWRSDIQLLIDALRRLVGDASTGRTRPNPATAAAQPEVPPQEGKGSSNLENAGSARIDAARVDPAIISPTVIDPVVIQRVTQELAFHIGPIASIAVRRAAAQCSSVEDLYLKVAEEIDSLNGREKFLLKCALIAPTSLPEFVRATPRAISASRAMEPPSPSRKNYARLETTLPVTAAQPSNRGKYFIFAGVGVVLVILALVFGPRFAPRGADSSQTTATSREQSPVAESVPIKPATPPPAAPTPTQNDEPAKPPATGESGPKSPEAVRVSQDVSLGLVIHKVSPVYPPLAQQARVQGLVVLDAKISKDGTVEALKMISGHPLLVPAAIDAVKQWRYKPYVLDGKPVTVNTQVIVNFTLSVK